MVYGHIDLIVPMLSERGCSNDTEGVVSVRLAMRRYIPGS